MVDSISSANSAAGLGRFPTAQALTDDQKEKIQSILSQYDPSNITADDAKAIFKSFKDAGIQPAAGMKEAITTAGFDADKLRSLARPEGGPPPGGQPSQTGSTSKSKTLDVTSLQSLQTILSQYDLSNLSDNQQTDLLSQLNQAGLIQSGKLIDLSA
jgi:hypothetical protein